MDQEYVTRSEFGRLTEMVEENTKLTREVANSTEDVVSAFLAAKGAFKVLEVIGRIGKPITIIASIGAGVVVAWGQLKTKYFS